MEFNKISEQNAWDAVKAATAQVRQGEAVHPSLLEWFRAQGVNVDQSVFPCIGLFDDGVFFGTLVNQDRRVIEYFVDLESGVAGRWRFRGRHQRTRPEGPVPPGQRRQGPDHHVAGVLRRPAQQGCLITPRGTATGCAPRAGTPPPLLLPPHRTVQSHAGNERPPANATRR